MKYIIHSKSERGFWNNKQGWVYRVTGATKFPNKEFNLPQSSGYPNDAEWQVYCYDEETDDHPGWVGQRGGMAMDGYCPV